jgi:hypothetical protein
MTSMTRSPPFGRPTKRKRADAELHDLARAMAADWTPGDTVQTWLRKHEGKAGELSCMVGEGWSWEDLGKAMHIAGISYRTGQPISANTLRHKAYLARESEQRRVAAEAARQAPFRPPGPVSPNPIPVAAAAGQTPALPSVLPAPPEPAPRAAPQAARSAPVEPMFRIVALKGGQQPKPQPPPSRHQHEKSAIAKVSDDEILRRVFGKP